MSTTSTTEAVRWTCERCGVSVGRIDDAPAALPDSWAHAGELTHCLSCRRALAGDAALDAAPPESTREELVRIRRNGLIEFELGRDPESPDRTVARACGTSPSAVAAIRQTLEAAPAVAASSSDH
jgi:hypothetical protein